MDIFELRRLSEREIIDYQFLISALSSYKRPRDKISGWLKKGYLTRVKKGLYIFGTKIAQHPYSKELLANLIYGPSAVSLSSALSYYGLIPEGTRTMMSVTNKRNKFFDTPVGGFSYYYLNNEKYSVGVNLEKSSFNTTFLIASPEKALCDTIHLQDTSLPLRNESEIENYLLHDLRFDENYLNRLNVKLLQTLCRIYKDKRLNYLVKLVKEY